MGLVRLVLFVVGYPTAIAVIARWIPVVRQQRVWWFAAHTAAVSAIVLGWALAANWPAVAVNGAWLGISAGWFLAVHRSASGRTVSRRQRP